MNEPRTAIIYARVSSIRQADEGISVDSQIEHGERKAKELGATIAHVFRDDGKTGRNDSRAAFQNAIAYCEAYVIDYFICWSTSRFARNKIDAAVYKRSLYRGGTKVVYTSVNIDSETDEGWLMESILEVNDELLSRQISKDTRRSMMKNARDGFWNGGRVPFGYEVYSVGNRRKLRIVDHEAVVVREIFNSYLAGDGTKSIAMSLNEQGLLNRGIAWNKSQVIRLLKNPVYAGLVVFNRVSANGIQNPESEWIMTQSHEKIVTREQFDRVRLLFEQKNHNTPIITQSNHVFSGLFRCGLCGQAMQIETANSRGRKYSYYNCSTHQKTGGCRSRRINAEEFDLWMVQQIFDKILNRDIVSEMVTEMIQLTGQYRRDYDLKYQALLAQKYKNNRESEQLLSILTSLGTEAPGMKSIVRKLGSLEEEVEIINKSLLNLEKSPPVSAVSEDQVDEAMSVLRDLIINSENNKQTRSLISTFVDSIVLDESVVTVNYKPGKLINKKNRVADANAVHSSVQWLPDLDSNQGPAD